MKPVRLSMCTRCERALMTHEIMRRKDAQSHTMQHRTSHATARATSGKVALCFHSTVFFTQDRTRHFRSRMEMDGTRCNFVALRDARDVSPCVPGLVERARVGKRDVSECHVCPRLPMTGSRCICSLTCNLFQRTCCI